MTFHIPYCCELDISNDCRDECLKVIKLHSFSRSGYEFKSLALFKVYVCTVLHTVIRKYYCVDLSNATVLYTGPVALYTYPNCRCLASASNLSRLKKTLLITSHRLYPGPYHRNFTIQLIISIINTNSPILASSLKQKKKIQILFELTQQHLTLTLRIHA